MRVVAEAASAVDPIPPLFQYGAVGILAAILLLLSYRLLKKFEESLDYERQGRKKAEEALAQQNEYIRDKIVPQFERINVVMAQTLEALQRNGYGSHHR